MKILFYNTLIWIIGTLFIGTLIVTGILYLLGIPLYFSLIYAFVVWAIGVYLRR